MLVPSLQKFLGNFCNLFSVNVEMFPMKSNLNYRLLSLVLLGSFSVGMVMIFLTKISFN